MTGTADEEAFGDVAPAETTGREAIAGSPKTTHLAGNNPGNYRIIEADAIGTGTESQCVVANLTAIRLWRLND